MLLDANANRNFGLYLEIIKLDEFFSIFFKQIEDSTLCIQMEGVDYMSSAGHVLSHPVCVSSFHISDGVWHDIRAERYGHNLLLEIDDGDSQKRNTSLVPLLMPRDIVNPPGEFFISSQGVMIGGVPEFVGAKVVTIHHDLENSK